MKTPTYRPCYTSNGTRIHAKKTLGGARALCGAWIYTTIHGPRLTLDDVTCQRCRAALTRAQAAEEES